SRKIPVSFGRMTMLQKSTWICSFMDIPCERDSSLLSMEEREARLIEKKNNPQKSKSDSYAWSGCPGVGRP
ncbi:hypothetical protein H8958_020396, partial [Nasalis larvatus]